MQNIILNEKTKKYKNHRYSSELSGTLFILPFLIAFLVFFIIPVIMGIGLSFTKYDLVQAPEFLGTNFLNNYISLFTGDSLFMQKVIPNTLVYAVFTGPIGYFLGFLLAWMLAQIPKRPRTVLALFIYSPSMTAGISMSVMWKIIFSGDEAGYLNAILLELGTIQQPIQWLQNGNYLMIIMIIVTLWGSMGIGFLAMLAGVLNIDQTLYEAAYVDGLKGKFQEMIYITIPQMKPQMLFGAIMALVNTFNSGLIGVQLSGTNPTPNEAGQLIATHIDDYAWNRWEMGYSATISVVLLAVVYLFGLGATKLFGEKE